MRSSDKITKRNGKVNEQGECLHSVTALKFITKMFHAKIEGLGGTKIALKVNNQRELININKELGLEPNISFLVHKYELPLDQKYGLKLKEATNNKESKRSNLYVTEKTYDDDVQDGNILELVKALDEVVNDIFINIKKENFEEACNDLYNVSSDPALINEIIETDRVGALLDLFLNSSITEKGDSGCLLIILQLLKNNRLQPLRIDIIDKIIDITMVKSITSQYGLSVLGQILYSTNTDFIQNKTQIIKKISMTFLVTYMLCKENIDLQINALILINAILKCSKFEHRIRIIGELAKSTNREKIFKLITEQNITDKLAKQLFLLQSYMFLAYKENLKKLALPGSADFNFNSPICFEHELAIKDTDSLKAISPAVSMSSLYKDNISRSSMISTDRGSYSSDSQVAEYSEYISVLTYNCLVYYKQRHSRSFTNSQCEENSFEPGICKSSERVIRIIADTLNMGQKTSRNCTRYVPLYFNPETNNFMEELFSKMMFLLSQTRREMKARLLEDYEKVIAVLRKQLEIILEKKPRSFKEFHLHITEINYETVRKQWQDEKQKEWSDKLRSNPCIIDLRKRFDEINDQIVFKERMNALHKGDVFRKQPDKKHNKPHHYFKFHLSPNNKILHYGDYKITEDEFITHLTVNVKDIRHIITGQACPLIKDNLVDHSLINSVFTVVLPDNTEINCLAPNEKKANYWIDGFNILRDNPTRSKDYHDDLKALTDMDCTLHLLELQNVPLPTQRPPIPPYPDSNKPEIPPKPEHLKRSISTK